MSYTLEVTKTIINIPIVSGDLTPDDLEGFMPASVVGQEYTVDLTFTLAEEGAEIPVPIEELIVETPELTGITFTTLSANTIRASGVFDGVDFNSGYTILLESGGQFIAEEVTQAQLPDNFVAIVAWRVPTVFFNLKTNSYRFTANPGDVTETSILESQYIYWPWQSALQAFQTDLQKGII